MLLALCDLATVVRAARCSSSPTCPAYDTEASNQCFVKGYSHFWGFNASPFYKFDFPGKGLYTFVKTEKDVSSCCHKLEVQGFMCHVLKGGSPVRAHMHAPTPHLHSVRMNSHCHMIGACLPTPTMTRLQVEGKVLLKQLIIRASALGTLVDVVIRNDDTMTVRYNGATFNFASTREDYTHSYGSPTILTVQRYGMVVQRGVEYAWRVTFTFGGSVTVWPTTRAGNKDGRFDENTPLWAWINVPKTLADQATGVCTASCPYSPPMPYLWCEGDANCLPTRVDATLFTSSEVAVLEGACGFGNTGDSQRPNVCTNRGSTLEVDCQYLAGSTGTNRAVHKKWPMNKDIFNGRHSGCLPGDSSLAANTYYSCPSTHPYAYQPPNFGYCCATANDNEGNAGINAVFPSSGRAATCEGHNHWQCPTPPCSDYEPSICPPTHPFAYNPPHFDHCCASRNDDTMNKGINAVLPSSGRSTSCRGNSQPCVTPPCGDWPVSTTPRTTPACPYYWNLAQTAVCPKDGVCDSGACNAMGCRSGSFGTGGCVEDPDCEYGYLVRDIPVGLSLTSQVPHQACWDYCTDYVLTGEKKNRCKARKMLANGGQIFCGYKGGKYVGMTDPYNHRCHVFVFPGDATLYDHYDSEIIGPDPPQTTSPVLTSFWLGANSVGPYQNFYMTERACNTNLDQTCAPDTEDLCAASGVTLADAQFACVAFVHLPFHVSITWGAPAMSKVYHNVWCPVHPSQSGLYICATHDLTFTKLVAYSIAAFNATPTKVGGKYYNGAQSIDDQQSIANAWDNAPGTYNTYEASEFDITNQASVSVGSHTCIYRLLLFCVPLLRPLAIPLLLLYLSSDAQRTFLFTADVCRSMMTASKMCAPLGT